MRQVCLEIGGRNICWKFLIMVLQKMEIITSPGNRNRSIPSIFVWISLLLLPHKFIHFYCRCKGSSRSSNPYYTSFYSNICYFFTLKSLSQLFLLFFIPENHNRRSIAFFLNYSDPYSQNELNCLFSTKKISGMSQFGCCHTFVLFCFVFWPYLKEGD